MNPPKLLNEQELEEALEQAMVAADDADARLQLVADDTPEAQMRLLEEDFAKANAEIERFRKALERKEDMNRAKAARPGANDESKRPALGGPRIGGPDQVTYRKHGPNSFYRDALALSSGGHDPGAVSRMARHYSELKQEFVGEEWAMTVQSGSGIGLAPPRYLQDELLDFARAGRPLADAIGSEPLPLNSGGSFPVPRITTGAVAAVQASEGGAVQDNSDVTDTITMTPSTIAAKVDMSRQLFDFSTPTAESVITRDLGSAYGLQVDSEIINGPGSGGRVKGILTAAASNTVTGTTTAAGNYPKIADAIQRVDTNRFLPASLLVMHPRRWAQFLAALDTTSRPLVVPNPVGFNTLAQGGAGPNVSQGNVGYILQGVPVLKDANIPTNLGAATNEDRILVARIEDYLFFEAGPTVRVYEEVLSGTLQVRVQAFGYIAFTAERVSGAVSTYLITGLTPPTF